MKIIALLMLIYTIDCSANCININGELYCNQNMQSPNIQYNQPQPYIPNTQYYPPQYYQQPQVIITPQITPGNPNIKFERFDTGKVIKRREN